jgi:hypothetical protein
VLKILKKKKSIIFFSNSLNGLIVWMVWNWFETGLISSLYLVSYRVDRIIGIWWSWLVGFSLPNLDLVIDYTFRLVYHQDFVVGILILISESEVASFFIDFSQSWNRWKFAIWECGLEGGFGRGLLGVLVRVGKIILGENFEL